MCSSKAERRRNSFSLSTPPNDFLPALLLWHHCFYLLVGKDVLSATVLYVWLDTLHSADDCRPIAPLHAKHIRRSDLVCASGVARLFQRHLCVHCRVFHREAIYSISSNQSVCKYSLPDCNSSLILHFV